MDEAEFEAELQIQREMEATEFAAELQVQREMEATEVAAPEAEEATDVPMTDWQALQLLLQLAGSDWKSYGGRTLFVYKDGLWTMESGCSSPMFVSLVTTHRQRLGKRYGESVHGINNLRNMAMTVNRVDCSWTEGLNQLPAGLVPFSNGIYDLQTRELREYRREDKLTERFNFCAPSPEDDYSEEYAEVVRIFAALLPEERLKHEVMSRLAESLMSPTNTHKMFLQLWGRGNNGKTTVLRMLHTAFPIWVKLPASEHLAVHAHGRDPNAPQPWLLDVMGARLLGFEEPPRHAKFDGSMLKLLRGNSMVTGRKCYGENVSYVPTYTLCFATNAPVEISPADEAVLNSLHSFEMPSFFKGPGDRVPLGTAFVKEKIPNLEARFEERKYKLALLEFLRDYWVEYRRMGNTLPELQSRFSAPWSEIYREANPTLDEIFEQCIEVRQGASTEQRRLFSALELNGYKGNETELRHYFEQKFASHRVVKKRRTKRCRMWDGLQLADEGEICYWA